MKTVMDAVNEFEGVFTLEDQDNDDKMILEVIKEDSMDVVGELRCGYEGYSKEYRVMVCNESQFNDLVSQLETNFGESLSYKEYVSIQAVGASMVGKPSQPVFTQAMADNGELPVVGSKCDFETAFFTAATLNKGTCEILAYHGGKVWINIIDFDYVINLNVIDFKPIDTKTDKEKAADEFIKDMTDSDFIKEQFKKTFLAGAEWAGE
jgi:hypothetical protein